MSTLLRVLGSAVLGAGLVLVVLGVRAHDSTASAVTRLFSGSPTRESVMLLGAGGAAILAGMVLIVAPGLVGSSSRRRGKRR